ncbi:hypothetical protein SAY87_023980 [Trapa incisa]|uniref:Protein kinase domain-containing protein n=1 Tax=Trapa incisa TaxID=236973 RepID=A0AAN7L1I5_9MYRT|nr:hypothetical protein SAY87_023980 [Trapa incisa]
MELWESSAAMEIEWVRGEEIGHGAFARICLAVPQKGKKKEKHSGRLPPLMAVKSCDLSKSVTLRNELRIFRRLGECPHVIRCFGSDVSVEGGSDVYNLLLEYAPGGSLVSEMKKRGGKLPETEVRRYTQSILQALRHIHRSGFVHGDIKVQNILVFPPVCGCGVAAEVKVADFGLAREAGSSTRSTTENDGGDGVDGSGGFEWRGTPLYMSPEAVNKNEHEAPSDVWALGCAVVEMAGGRPAWDQPAGANAYSLMLRIGVGGETPTIPQDLSEEGKDFLRKCFVKDPMKRWTAEMLLSHPFVALESRSDLWPPLPRPPSPRSHFDLFLDWDSSVQSSTASISPSPAPLPWEFRRHESEFDFRPLEEPENRVAIIERIQSLACSSEMPNWEEDSDGSLWFAVK